jgi:hypothetical protein
MRAAFSTRLREGGPAAILAGRSAAASAGSRFARRSLRKLAGGLPRMGWSRWSRSRRPMPRRWRSSRSPSMPSSASAPPSCGGRCRRSSGRSRHGSRRRIRRDRRALLAGMAAPGDNRGGGLRRPERHRGALRRAGFAVTGLVAASEDDWDRYASLHWRAIEEWLAENPTTRERRTCASSMTGSAPSTLRSSGPFSAGRSSSVARSERGAV